MVLFTRSLIAATATLLAGVFAHPGYDATAEVAQRAECIASTGKRSLFHCDFTSVLNTYHLSNEIVTPDSSDSVIFAGNNSCILTHEVTEDPYR